MALYESLCVRDISIHSALRQQFVTKSLLSVQFVEPRVGLWDVCRCQLKIHQFLVIHFRRFSIFSELRLCFISFIVMWSFPGSFSTAPTPPPKKNPIHSHLCFHFASAVTFSFSPGSSSQPLHKVTLFPMLINLCCGSFLQEAL